MIKLTSKCKVYRSNLKGASNMATEVLILKELLQNIKLNEKRSNHLKRLKDIGEIWDDLGKSECEQSMQDYRQYLKDIKQVEKLTEKMKAYPLTENYEEMKLELQLGKKLTCPNCRSNLHYDSKHECLVISTNSSQTRDPIDLEQTIKDYEKKEKKKFVIIEQINSIQGNYEEFTPNDKDEIQTCLSSMKKYYNQNIGLEHEKLQLKGKLKKLPLLKHIPTKTEEDIRTEICSLEVQTQLYNENTKNLQEVELELKQLQMDKRQKIQVYTSKYMKQVSEEKINQRITKYLEVIQQLEIDRETYQHTITQITAYHHYIVEKTECLTFNNKIKSLHILDKQLRDRLAATLLLKSKIKEAESIAISNIIQSINTFAKNYLHCFFPDDPINVTITPFKEGKKVKKPQIHVYIEYKGMECDVGILSGGERQRVVLAFTLALAEMYQTPFLLLDECSSNLDQELTNTIIQGIKKTLFG